MKNYAVVDSHFSDKIIATYATRKAAQRRADKLDLEYGAVRYSVRNIAPPWTPRKESANG